MSVVAARLGVHVSQGTFRALIETTSRPGTIARLPETPDGVPAAMLPVLALSDVEVPVRVLADDAADWEDVVAVATGARSATTDAVAALVTALRPIAGAEVLGLRRGTALCPEDGARLVIAVTSLEVVTETARPDADSVVLELSGPGVIGTRRLRVGGLGHEAADAIRATRAGYPAGIDVHFVSRDGHVASVPRSSHVVVEHAALVTSGGAD